MVLPPMSRTFLLTMTHCMRQWNAQRMSKYILWHFIVNSPISCHSFLDRVKDLQ